MSEVREVLGRVVGLMLAPITGFGAALRHARFFHPEGAVYRATLSPAPNQPFPGLAERLSGEALVRASTAWWRHGREWPDVLGLAVRIMEDHAITSSARRGDQDLLFATIRWPWTTPFAPLTTRQHDFLMNNYHGVSPFDVPGIGRAKWRLLSPHVRVEGQDRGQRLDRAVEAGLARFQLQVRPLRRGAPWVTVAELVLREHVHVDQEALRFSPFRSGRGIRPIGLVQEMRRAAYRASQAVRPRHEGPHVS